MNLLKVTFDGKYLLSAGADGTLFIHSIIDFTYKFNPQNDIEEEILSPKNVIIDEQMANLLLVEKQDILVYKEEHDK